MRRLHNYNFYVYILTNVRHTVLYTGITNSLVRRSWEHAHKMQSGFTKKYNINKLIYYEHFLDIKSAIAREKAVKKLSRRNKVILIRKMNPEWKDLFDTLEQ